MSAYGGNEANRWDPYSVFLKQRDNLFLCVSYTRETLDLLQCILLSHCQNIKEMTSQKELWNIKKYKLVIRFHM